MIADATQNVKNRVSTGDPQNPREVIGANGGPELYVREVKKLTAIEAVLKNPKFNQTQALILIGLIIRSDEAYSNAFPGAVTLALYAKVKQTDTVFKALKELEDQFKLITRESRGQGRSNSYNVLPQRIIDAAEVAYEERKAAKKAEREAAAAIQATHPAQQGGLPKPTPPNVAPRSTGAPAEQGPTHPAQRGTYPE